MRIAMLLICFALAPVLPAAAQAMTSQLQACQAVSDAQQRLACYDRISRGQPGVPAAPAPYAPAPYAPARPAAPPINSQAYVNQFGEEDMGVVEPSHRLRAIVFEITDYKLDLRGKFIVTLANGQSWRQLEVDTGITHPRSTAKRVKIERGFVGSYKLEFNDMRPSFKVERVR